MNENKNYEKIDDNKNIEIPTPKDILKQEILFIFSEYKNKLSEYKNIQENIINSKVAFKKLLSEYTNIKNIILEKEKEKESILLKESKMRKNLLISINKTINAKFYNHLEGIIGDKQKEKLIKLFFNFALNLYNINNYYHFKNNEEFNDNDIENLFLSTIENQDMKNILRILKGEAEIKNLILYCIDIIQNLHKEDNIIYDKIKNMYANLYKKIKNEEKQYPIDLLYDFFNNIFSISNYENQIEEIKRIINNLTKEKNEKFIKVKNLEALIKSYNTKKRLILNYIKELNSFLLKLKNVPEKHNYKNIDELTEEIGNFKKIINKCEKMKNNFDMVTSLPIGNKFIISDKSSMKGILLEFKNNIEDFDNIIGDRENQNQHNNKKNNLDEIRVKKENKSNNSIFNEKENIKFHRIVKSNNAIKLEESKRYKINNLIKFRNKENNINILNYKTMNNNASLIKNKNFKKITNNIIKFKEKPNKNVDGKTFTKINKNMIINRNRDNRKEKENNLIKKFKSQKIMKIIQNNRNSKSTKENKSILALNNIIFSDNKNESYINKNNYIHNITYNEQENKTQIIRKPNNYTKITPQKKEKLRNYSEKYKEKKLFKKQNFSAVKIININNFNKFEMKEQTKQTEQDNSVEITRPNKEINLTEEPIDLGEIKDSICEEIGSQDFKGGNYLNSSVTKNYINKLGTKHNIIWSESLYNNKNRQKNDIIPLNIEKPIDSFTCCTSCT